MGYELRHTEVIERFGAGRLARVLSLPRSTVYSWRQAGVIPARHHANIMAAAKSEGIDLSPGDFIGPSRDGGTAHGASADVCHVQ